MEAQYLLLIFSSFLHSGSTFFQKKYTQLTDKGGLSASLIYIFGSAVLSMLSFFLMAGGTLVFSRTILLYSVLSGLVYNAANLINLFAYRNINLVLISVFGKAVTVTTWLLGVTVFGEIPTAGNIISIIIIVISFFLPLVDFKKSGGSLKTTYIIGSLQLLISTLNTLILKLYTDSPGVSAGSVSSLLFFSCSFMTIPPVVIMLSRLKKGSARVKQELSGLTSAAILCIVLVNLFGNPSSLVSTLAMKGLPLLTYSIISSALNSLCVFISSKLFFKERVGKITVIALVLSTVASIINVM